MTRKLRHILIAVLCIGSVLVAAYGVFGFHFAPDLLRRSAVTWVQQSYGRRLAIGSVRINPFLLRVEVRDLALPDADGQPMLGARRLLVDFEVASLWRRAWVFKTIELDQPAVRVVLRADGRINLVDLAQIRGAAPAPATSPSPPALWLKSLAVTAGQVEYFEAARAQPLVKRITPIAFSLRDFHSTAAGGRFVLSARTAADERFEWSGRIATTPRVSAEGDISVQQLHLATLVDLLPTLPVTVGSGDIDLAGQYALTLGDGVGLTLQLPQMSLSNLALGGSASDSDWLRVDRIALEQMRFDLAARNLHATALRVEGLRARTWLDASGALNLQQLLPRAAPEEPVAVRPPAPVAAPAVPTPAAPAPPAAAPRPWQAGVDGMQWRAVSVEFEDRRIPSAARIQIDPVDITTGAVGTELSRAVPVKLQARVDGKATLQLEGQLTPAPLAASLRLSLTDAPLALLQPYILPMADLSIRSGTASTTGRIEIRSTAGRPAAFVYEGDASLERLHSVDNTLQQDLLNLRRMQVQKLRFSTAPAGLSVARVLLQEPYARVVVSPEQIVNISAVFNPRAAAAQLAQRRAAQSGAAPRQESRGQRRARERAEQAQRKAKAAAPLPPETDAPEAFPIRIGEVRVQKGRMDFSDFNIRPNFSAQILDLQGAVTALSSARSSRAKVDLKGNLGEFSPVTIGGTLRPFAFDRFTDIALKFENIALPVFNPYSGTFAGYNIAKGKLTTELHYQIADRKLNAAHHIRIDQLEWGEASEFKGEATLPVKFATALLRDRDGVIQLDIPVTGSLDDPQFRMGPIVWQVIKNIVVKAATAPFALLGSLFAGAEQAQFVDFAPGDAVLEAAAGDRLASLAKGLADKPDISLDVPLAAAPEPDRPALAQLKFAQLLESVARAAQSPGATAEAAPPYATLDATQKRAALTAWFRAQKRALPELPAAPTAPQGATRAEQREQADRAAAEFLEGTLRDTVSVADGELEQLAQARAAAIEAALLRGGELTASRVFLVRGDHVQMHEGRIRLQLELK